MEYLELFVESPGNVRAIDLDYLSERSFTLLDPDKQNNITRPDIDQLMGLDALTDPDNNTVGSRKRSVGRSASRLKYKDSDFILLSPRYQGKKTKGPLSDLPPR